MQLTKAAGFPLAHLRGLRRRWRQAMQPATFVPPGHCYSPVVDPAELSRSGFDLYRNLNGAPGVSVDQAVMEAFFQQLVPAMPACVFPADRDPAMRYWSRNAMFGVGDATFLSAIVRALRPKRYYEIGSGFSTSAVLDAIDATDGYAPEMLLVEPDPARLRSLLRQGDEARFKLLACGAQDTDPEMYRALEAGDVLFIDSTHVAKTGSDVNFELFEILPRLQSGVLVHIHDIFPVWEYPRDWVFDENRSWNEIYLVRAFLMYNSAFEIVMFPGIFARDRPDLMQRHCPAAMQDAGVGIWLRRK